MKIWLIGCGAFLLIILIVGGYGVNLVTKEFSAAQDSLKDTADQLTKLDEEFPFASSPSQAITEEQMVRFSDCRKPLLIAFEELANNIQSEERSMFKKIGDFVNIIPQVGQRHVEGLKTASMSPAEYVWIMNHTLCLIKYGERDDAPDKLKELRKAFENATPNETDLESQRKDHMLLLPQIDPYMIQPPEASIAAILEKGYLLKESFIIFGQFDKVFRDFYANDVIKSLENK